MDGILLLLPILVPILGGLAVLGIHNMKTRRLTVTLLLVFQIFVVLEVARNDTEPFVLLQLTDGARLGIPAPDLAGYPVGAAVCQPHLPYLVCGGCLCL